MDELNVFELGEICLFYEHFHNMLYICTYFQLTHIKGKTSDYFVIYLNIKL